MLCPVNFSPSCLSQSAQKQEERLFHSFSISQFPISSQHHGVQRQLFFNCVVSVHRPSWIRSALPARRRSSGRLSDRRTGSLGSHFIVLHMRPHLEDTPPLLEHKSVWGKVLQLPHLWDTEGTVSRAPPMPSSNPTVSPAPGPTPLVLVGWSKIWPVYIKSCFVHCNHSPSLSK